MVRRSGREQSHHGLTMSVWWAVISDFRQILRSARSMAGSVVHTGEIGAGNDQAGQPGDRGAEHCGGDVRKALTLATKAGVNPDLVYQAIRAGWPEAPYWMPKRQW